MAVLAVSSGKGGVGKTTLVAAIGAAQARLGRRVLLVDGDLALANLDVVLGVRPHGSLYDVVRGTRKLSEILHRVGPGLDLAPGGSGLGLLMQSGPKRLNVILSQLAELADDYDEVLIDTSAGLDSRMTTFCRVADFTVLVVTPDSSSMVDAFACAKILHKLDSTLPMGWLVNQATSEAQGQAVLDRLGLATEQFLDCAFPAVGMVPYDPNPAHRSRVLDAFPDSGVGVAWAQVAREIGQFVRPGRFADRVHARLVA